jgi:hypothetical protein
LYFAGGHIEEMPEYPHKKVKSDSGFIEAYNSIKACASKALNGILKGAQT